DLVLRVPDAARRVASRIVFPDGDPTIVVHPGCTMPARTYPAERYAEVVTHLARAGAHVLLTGTTEEAPLVGRILDALPAPERARCVPLAGMLQFAELAAVIEASDGVVTNNTGPMHVAAAMKTPVVALFALTNPPEQWGPWRVPHRLLNRDVPCRLCYARACPYAQECLDVAPEEVARATFALIADSATRAEAAV
ncbi:MAG TPA: glycosyltransferase family 9 protein, partial [Candidatus Limnocylindria bacterium]